MHFQLLFTIPEAQLTTQIFFLNGTSHPSQRDFINSQDLYDLYPQGEIFATKFVVALLLHQGLDLTLQAHSSAMEANEFPGTINMSSYRLPS